MVLKLTPAESLGIDPSIDTENGDDQGERRTDDLDSDT